MTSDSIKGDHEMTPRSRPVNFAILMGWIMAGQAAFAASVVGFAGLALGVPVHKLLVPFLLLLYCGLVLSPFVYWARLARERPRSYALRFGIAIFSYLSVFTVALTFGAIKAGVLSPADAINDGLPFVLLFSAFGSGIAYFVARQVFGATKPGRSNGETTTKPEAGNDQGSSDLRSGMGAAMNSKPINGAPGQTPGSESVNYVTWTLTILAGVGTGAAIVVGFAGLALGVPARKLLLPFAAFFSTGFVLSPLLYWARVARERPRSCAIRSSVAMFFFSQALLIAFSFSAINLGILSLGEVLDWTFPFLVAFIALVSIAFYFGECKRLGATKSGRSDSETTTKPEAGNDQGSSDLR